MLKKAIITIITIISVAGLFCGCGLQDNIAGRYYNCYTAEDGKSWEYDDSMYLELNNDNTGLLKDRNKIFPVTWEKDGSKMNITYTDTVWGKTTNTMGEYFDSYYSNNDATLTMYFAGNIYAFSIKPE